MLPYGSSLFLPPVFVESDSLRLASPDIFLSPLRALTSPQIDSCRRFELSADLKVTGFQTDSLASYFISLFRRRGRYRSSASQLIMTGAENVSLNVTLLGGWAAGQNTGSRWTTAGAAASLQRGEEKDQRKVGGSAAKMILTLQRNVRVSTRGRRSGANPCVWSMKSVVPGWWRENTMWWREFI